jgi:hypothetical protein
MSNPLFKACPNTTGLPMGGPLQCDGPCFEGRDRISRDAPACVGSSLPFLTANRIHFAEKALEHELGLLQVEAALELDDGFRRLVVVRVEIDVSLFLRFLVADLAGLAERLDRKSTRLNSSHK